MSQTQCTDQLQHTQKHVSPNAIIIPMPNRTNVKMIIAMLSSRRVYEKRFSVIVSLKCFFIL